MQVFKINLIIFKSFLFIFSQGFHIQALKIPGTTKATPGIVTAPIFYRLFKRKIPPIYRAGKRIIAYNLFYAKKSALT